MPGQIQRIKNRTTSWEAYDWPPMCGITNEQHKFFVITKNKDGWRGGGGKTQQMNHPPAHSEDKFGIGGTV